MTSERTHKPVALVTGASSGIGEATARRLASDGYAVAISARRAERLEALAESIRRAGGEALVLPGDITDPDFSRNMVRTAAVWGGLEILVANAGMGYTGPYELMSDDEMRRMIDTNVLGVFRPVQEAIAPMRARGGGKIVIVGSVLSRIATPGTAVYCATKHALVGFADALRHEVRNDGIRIISVLPGYTSTEFFDAMIRRGERSVDAIKKYWFFHTPEDVAAVISRRVAHPCAEVVVGAANTAVVILATRFPGLYHSALALVEQLANRCAARGDSAAAGQPSSDPKHA
jgi:short-subunit dehydrogenase